MPSFKIVIGAFVGENYKVLWLIEGNESTFIVSRYFLLLFRRFRKIEKRRLLASSYLSVRLSA